MNPYIRRDTRKVVTKRPRWARTNRRTGRAGSFAAAHNPLAGYMKTANNHPQTKKDQ